MANIPGTPLNNTLVGTNSNDIINRDGDPLSFPGTRGNDSLFGRAGLDLLYGGSGDDRLNGGVGNDTLNGGTGIDTADYSSGTVTGMAIIGATAGVTVNLNLAGPQNTGGAGIDQLVSIENLFGTNFNDTLTGNNFNNVLFGLSGNDLLTGGGGNDTLNGGLGNDTMNGGTGSDTASYFTATAGVSVNLNLAGAQNTGGDGIDQLVSIENLTGSRFNDVLTGNNFNNVLSGLNGNDQLTGGGGNDTLNGGLGNDTLNGGTGSDTADYSTATAGVTVIFDDYFNPSDSYQSAGGGGIDTLVSIENLIGSTFNDHLGGTLESGSLTVKGGDGNDDLFFEFSGGELYGEAGDDLLSAFDGGGTLDGGAGNDTLAATLGVYELNGGDGNDVLDFAQNFGEGSTLNGGAGNDVLNAFDALSTTLNGGDGNDTLTAEVGSYSLNGGAGNDLLQIRNPTFASTLDGGLGNDIFDYDSADDSPAGAERGMIIGFAGNGAAVGDKIDLTGIDANALVAGNQAFIFGGPFTAGHLRYNTTTGILSGNTNGDAAAEFEIQLVGAPALSVGGAGTDILL